MNDVTTLDFIIIAASAFVAGILFRRWVRAKMKANKSSLEKDVKQDNKKQ